MISFSVPSRIVATQGNAGEDVLRRETLPFRLVFSLVSNISVRSISRRAKPNYGFSSMTLRKWSAIWEKTATFSEYRFILDILLRPARDAILCSAVFLLVIDITRIDLSSMRFEMPSAGVRRYYRCHYRPTNKDKQTQWETRLSTTIADEMFSRPIYDAGAGLAE